jgi:regulatory protein
MKDALGTAASLLSRRAHSKAELRRKLRPKGFSSEEIEAALSELERLGFLNDASFANALTDELHERGCGSRKISSTLARRGVARELAKEALDGVPSRDGAKDELSSAIDALARKLKTFEREPDFRKRKLKAMRFLAARGFGGEVAGKAIAAHPSLSRPPGGSQNF